MGLEAAGYIADIDPTWPLGTDNVSQGDDHLRNFKKSVQDSFPNITGPVTATQDEINAGGVPTGSLISYGGSGAPTGWLLCDGAAVDRTTYANLYIALGDAYGAGDGSTTFNVPDMRDKVAGGLSGSNVIGSDAGKDTWTSGDLPPHGHTTNATGSHQHNSYRAISGSFEGSGTKTGLNQDSSRDDNFPVDAAGSHSHTVNSTGTGGDNRQQTLYINYIIKI